jgi:hypothetical protein
MPLPSPEKKDKIKDFVSRFMGNEEANKTFPDAKQRAAVAYQTYRDWKSKQRRNKSLEDASIIPSVYILSQGEAKGHDLYIDKTSIEQAFELMKKAPNGVKVKMNHGSGLDAVVGLARNPRIEGDKLKADLHLLKSSPHYALIKEMADEAPDQFGVSLAFMNESETIEGKDYIRPKSIASADLVSSPASNERFKDFANTETEMLVFAVGTKFRCWEGYKPAKGVEAYEPGSCVKAEAKEDLGYNAGGESVPADIKQAIVESDPILDNKGKSTMDEQYKSDMEKINKRLEALEAIMSPKDETKKEEAPVAEAPSEEKSDKTESTNMSELVKRALVEFGIKPIPASPVVEVKAETKEEPKTFEALVAAHADYGTSKLKAMKAVMLSNPNEYAEALSRGISKI